MRYALCRFALDDDNEVQISPDQFHLAELAHDRMQLVIASEEKFDAVARNHLDFESDMLNCALETSLAGFGAGMEQMGVRRLLNRKLSNLLSATRSYVDFIRHSAKTVLPTQNDADEVINLFAKHYDSSFSYRALEVLRNHAQHAGFPIQSIKYFTSVLRDQPGNPLKKTVAPMLNTEDLSQNSELKKVVVSELVQLGETINLKRLIREYVAAMADVHERFREKAALIFDRDANTLSSLASLYVEATKTREIPVGLYAAAFESEICVKRVVLSSGIEKYGAFLAKGNAHFTHAGICFVSGEPEKDA
jgi:hypothetical protein